MLFQRKQIPILYMVRSSITSLLTYLTNISDKDVPSSGQGQIQEESHHDSEMFAASSLVQPQMQAISTSASTPTCKCSTDAQSQAFQIKALKQGSEFDYGIQLLAECVPKINLMCFNHIRLLASNGFGLLSSTGGISKFLLLHRLK
jgi:hypothetical protein